MAYHDRNSSRSKPADVPSDTIQSSPNNILERSIVDKTWGLLFKGNSPTERFGELNRGIANHINNVYDPKKTIVIPPTKMADLYSAYKLDKEKYPLEKIFRILSPAQISCIYISLGCEYYAVPDGDLKKAPTIPALTPLGFHCWMTLFVLAYPDEESERLQKIVEALPIDADGVLLEGKPERLPKQLSRYLLPPKWHHKSRELLENALFDFKDLATVIQTPTTIPIVNTNTSRSQPPYHKIRIPEKYQPQRSISPKLVYSQIRCMTGSATLAMAVESGLPDHRGKSPVFTTIQRIARMTHKLV